MISSALCTQCSALPARHGWLGGRRGASRMLTRVAQRRAFCGFVGGPTNPPRKPTLQDVMDVSSLGTAECLGFATALLAPSGSRRLRALRGSALPPLLLAQLPPLARAMTMLLFVALSCTAGAGQCEQPPGNDREPPGNDREPPGNDREGPGRSQGTKGRRGWGVGGWHWVGCCCKLTANASSSALHSHGCACRSMCCLGAPWWCLCHFTQCLPWPPATTPHSS